MLYLFGYFLIFIVWLNYKIRKDNKNTLSTSNDFWEQERAANSVRRVPLEKIPFIKIPYDTFPIGKIEDAGIKEDEDILLSLKEKHILNNTGMTSTELKEAYGPANLSLMDECDENFLILVKALVSYGEQLYSLGFEKEALTILEFGISIESDISQNYRLLAEIYQKNQQTDKIKWLLSTADDLRSLMKRSIREEILKLTDHTEE